MTAICGRTREATSDRAAALVYLTALLKRLPRPVSLSPSAKIGGRGRRQRDGNVFFGGGARAPRRRGQNAVVVGRRGGTPAGVDLARSRGWLVKLMSFSAFDPMRSSISICVGDDAQFLLGQRLRQNR